MKNRQKTDPLYAQKRRLLRRENTISEYTHTISGNTRNREIKPVTLPRVKWMERDEI